MIVRPAQDADLGALAILVNTAYRGEASRKGWATEDGLVGGQRVDVAMLREDIAPGKECTILLGHDEVSGHLIGCVKLETVGETAIDLGMLAIAPGEQAAGLGKQLLRVSEDFARAQGKSLLRITVIQLRETLIAWYERHGFRRTGETKPFPYGDIRFGLPMRDDLHFVVLEKALGHGT